MSEKIDYNELGFKSGIEVHQQLDTHKLFCDCPSILRKDEPDFIIERKLHAVAGESGEIDSAASYQASLNQDFFYQAYNDTTCLIELDEEPPHEINSEALKIALQISLLLNAKIVPITQIMRKTVIDGSNTSGFQRTVLIAKQGYIETSQGNIGIETICLEEDAARIISKEGNKSVYKLDRLGIPLIEIVTSPEIKTAEQVKEVALHIGEILRSCKVRRGIGTIRQDVNISIKKGERVEIKGFQDPAMMIETIDKEIIRQKNLISKGKKVEKEVRNALSDGSTEFLRPMPGAARMYPETDLELLKISREMINEAKKDLPQLRKDIEGELKIIGLNEEMIKLLFKENMLEDFKELILVMENPSLIAKMLLVFPKEIASHSKKDIFEVRKILNKDILIFVLENLKKKKINESQVKQVLEKILSGESLEKSILFESNVDSIEERIIKIIKNKPGLAMNAYMGLAMKEFAGKMSGKEIAEIIKKHIK
jgi:Glu-tRNA(Gln) amidotransferase subunit E-like FAD-binding protein